MEFIPLSKQGKKVKKTTGKKKTIPEKAEEVTEKCMSKTNKEVNIKKTVKGKPQGKIMQKKKVKNKYRELVGKKRKRTSSEDAQKEGKNGVEYKNDEEKEELKESQETDDEVEDDNEDEGGSENEEEDKSEDEDEEDEEEEEEEEEEEVDEEAMIQKKQENAMREKWKKMDEKMKNRLFVKMKKKIVNETQIKELHPDIRSVIFPRKKNTRWCWAVFSSQEKALAAFKKLSKSREVLVAKPNPREKVEMKREKTMMSIQRRKENKKKLQQMWT